MHVMFISIQMVLCWLSGESHACDVHQYSDGAVLAKWRHLQDVLLCGPQRSLSVLAVRDSPSRGGHSDPVAGGSVPTLARQRRVKPKISTNQTELSVHLHIAFSIGLNVSLLPTMCRICTFILGLIYCSPITHRN